MDLGPGRTVFPTLPHLRRSASRREGEKYKMPHRPKLFFCESRPANSATQTSANAASLIWCGNSLIVPPGKWRLSASTKMRSASGRAQEPVWRPERSCAWRTLSTLAAAIAKSKNAVFDFAVIDEAQDRSPSHLRFFASLGADRPNALFFAGDLGQLANRPLIHDQAFGEALDHDKLERLGRYEVHLDREAQRPHGGRDDQPDARGHVALLLWRMPARSRRGSTSAQKNGSSSI
jgi:hypothetical protein